MVTFEGIFLWNNHPNYKVQGLVRGRVGNWTIPRAVATPVPDSKSNPIQTRRPLASQRLISLKDGDQPGEQVRSCVTYAAPDKHSHWHGKRLECFFSSNIFELVQNCHLCLFLSALSTLLPPEVVLLPILVKSWQCCQFCQVLPMLPCSLQTPKTHTHTRQTCVPAQTDMRKNTNTNTNLTFGVFQLAPLTPLDSQASFVQKK